LLLEEHGSNAQRRQGGVTLLQTVEVPAVTEQDVMRKQTPLDANLNTQRGNLSNAAPDDRGGADGLTEHGKRNAVRMQHKSAASRHRRRSSMPDINAMRKQKLAKSQQPDGAKKRRNGKGAKGGKGKNNKVTPFTGTETGLSGAVVSLPVLSVGGSKAAVTSDVDGGDIDAVAAGATDDATGRERMLEHASLQMHKRNDTNGYVGYEFETTSTHAGGIQSSVVKAKKGKLFSPRRSSLPTSDKLLQAARHARHKASKPAKVAKATKKGQTKGKPTHQTSATALGKAANDNPNAKTKATAAGKVAVSSNTDDSGSSDSDDDSDSGSGSDSGSDSYDSANDSDSESDVVKQMDVTSRRQQQTARLREYTAVNKLSARISILDQQLKTNGVGVVGGDDDAAKVLMARARLERDEEARKRAALIQQLAAADRKERRRRRRARVAAREKQEKAARVQLLADEKSRRVAAAARMVDEEQARVFAEEQRFQAQQTTTLHGTERVVPTQVLRSVVAEQRTHARTSSTGSTGAAATTTTATATTTAAAATNGNGLAPNEPSPMPTTTSSLSAMLQQGGIDHRSGNPAESSSSLSAMLAQGGIDHRSGNH
jgi:hypothetical protein